MKTLHYSIIIAGIICAIVTGIVFAYVLPKPTSLGWTNNTFTITKDNCGQFYTIPENQHDFYTTPILLMDSNSTACARITFTVTDSYQEYNDTILLSMLRDQIHFPIGNYNVTTNGHSFGISLGKDQANLFNILQTRQTVDNYPKDYHIGDDPVYYPIGTNFTITDTIQALPHANGFYDYSIPKPNCGHYPLAVGYTANQVNASDFSKVNPLGQTCMRLHYEITAVQVSGMNYKELQLQPIPFKLAS